jgi:hypothetical protein
MKTSTILLVVSAALGCQAQGNAGSLGDSPGAAGAAPGDTTSGLTTDTAGVTLTLDKSDYTPNAPVVMTISSQRADTLGYNPCSDRSVERDTGGVWVVHPEPNRMCTMELRLLLPQQTQTAQTALPVDLVSGTYRVVLQLRPQRSDSAPSPVRAASAPFRVTGSAR